MRAARRLEALVFDTGLGLLAWMTRTRVLRPLSNRLLQLLGRFSAAWRHVRPQGSPEALAAAWQSVFPSPNVVPITSIEDGTVRAEIRIECPLRGSGDLHACYRLMEFDRTVAAAAGANFVVLRSQAEPGVTVCEVALRRKGVPTDDLKPAHLK